MKRRLGIACVVFLLTSSITLCSEEKEGYELLEPFGMAIVERITAKIFTDPIGCESKREGVVGIGAFVLTDYTINKAAQAIGDQDSVKKTTNLIKEEQRSFAWSAGKNMTRSTLSRVAMIIFRCGMINSDNMNKLRVYAMLNIRNSAIVHYAAKPFADGVFGKKDESFSKKLFTIASTIGMCYLANQLWESMASA